MRGAARSHGSAIGVADGLANVVAGRITVLPFGVAVIIAVLIAVHAVADGTAIRITVWIANGGAVSGANAEAVD